MLARRLRRPALAHPLALAACLLMAMAAAWPLATAHAAADPTLTLDPDRASCTDRIVVRGRNFPPGQAIALIAFLPGGGRAGVIGRATVPADGTFTIGVEVREFAGPCAGRQGRSPYPLRVDDQRRPGTLPRRRHGPGRQVDLPVSRALRTICSGCLC